VLLGATTTIDVTKHNDATAAALRRCDSSLPSRNKRFIGAGAHESARSGTRCRAALARLRLFDKQLARNWARFVIILCITIFSL